MNYRALVFDFDGTIADTLGEVHRIYREIAPDYGLRDVDPGEIDELRKLSLGKFVKHLGIPAYRLPSILARGTRMMRENITNLSPIDGMADALQSLSPRFASFGILTTNSRENVEAFLKTHGLDHHFDFVSSQSKLQGKARHLRAILTTFSWKPGQILYIGDELRDIEACQSAGIDIAAVTWGFNAREALAAANPKFLVDHPHELIALLK